MVVPKKMILVFILHFFTCFIITHCYTADHILRHIQLIHQMKQYHKNFNIQPPLFSVRSQTQSYMLNAKLRNNVLNAWPNELKDHRDLITSLLSRETQFAPSHYVFYHGQSGIFRFLQDLMTEVYEYLNINPIAAEFAFLRMWFENLEEVDINSFLASEFNDSESTGMLFFEWDHRDDLIKKMLSVNLSLFGNCSLIWFNECTFDYFIRNMSITPPKIEGLIDDFLEKIGIPESTMKQFLHEKFKTDDIIQKVVSCGQLLQIFIPKNDVDKIVYLSRPFGIPYSDKIASECFDEKFQRHTKISPILERYIQDPDSIEDIDMLQARIILSKNLMLNPESGIKIFRASLTNQENNIPYKDKLHEIVVHICNHLIEQNIFEKTDLIAHSPMAKLSKYIIGNSY